jgi:hypothetical protein
MKIKNLIKHLQILDQEKELVIMARDGSDWESGIVVNENDIELDEVYPCEDNGLGGVLHDDNFDPEEGIGVSCYVIRIQA